MTTNNITKATKILLESYDSEIVAKLLDLDIAFVYSIQEKERDKDFLKIQRGYS